MFISLFGSNNSICFQGKDLKGKDNVIDKLTNAREQNDASMETRTDWFQKHRPKEKESDGYVTTPGHSDDESRPSARRWAKKTSQTFDSSTQKFRLFAKSDK